MSRAKPPSRPRTGQIHQHAARRELAQQSAKRFGPAQQRGADDEKNRPQQFGDEERRLHGRVPPFTRGASTVAPIRIVVIAPRQRGFGAAAAAPPQGARRLRLCKDALLMQPMDLRLSHA